MQVPHDEATSLSHFIKVQGEKTNHKAMGSDANIAAAANLSWEEYKEERRRAKEHRKHEREQRGESGPLALLGLSSHSKEKKE